MSDINEYKPAIILFLLQILYSGISLSTRTALLGGMSPRVFVVYRQAIATLIIAPFSYFIRRKGNNTSLGWKSFWLIFLTSLIGITINQNIFFEGIYLATSSMASAAGNLVPAITFILASLVGLEKVNLDSLRSIAKIIGTTLCVGGAVSMALLRGPKLLNLDITLPISNSILGKGDEDNWLLGCLLLFGSAFCWSLWLIMQMPLSSSHPDHLSLTVWLCFIGMLQSAFVALVLDHNLEAWTLNSNIELFACLYMGFVSAISTFAQAWCISRRGPLFSAMFNPLCTVIVTIFASIFLHEEMYTGSLVGGIGVVIGLYIVLWGKAKDLEECHVGSDSEIDYNKIAAVKIIIDNECDYEKLAGSEKNLEDPLLAEGIHRDD